MHVLRFEAAERLRALALAAPSGPLPQTAGRLPAIQGIDDEATQVAWTSFVPFLAHPVMAGRAREAMHRIDPVPHRSPEAIR